MSISSSQSDSEMPLLHENDEQYVHSTLPEIIPRLKINDDGDGVIACSHKPSLGGLTATDDDEEGFKTPTSLESKIPVPTECPAAPKRRPYLRSVSPKIRKKKTYVLRGIVKLDEEVLESLFITTSEVILPESSDEDSDDQKMRNPQCKTN